MAKTTTADGFTFKATKTRLTITFDDQDTGEKKTIALTLPQWEAMGSLESSPDNDAGEVWRSLAYVCYSMRKVFLHLGICSERFYERTRPNIHGKPHTVKVYDVHALTPLGDRIADAMPKCPPRTEWPQVNRPPTEFQKNALGTIVSYANTGRSGALIGSSQVEQGWCPISSSTISHTTAKRLRDRDLIEVGYNEETMTLVVRATVHGALLAEK